MYIYIYKFIYLSIYYLFISITRKQKATFIIFYLPFCVQVFTVSLLVRLFVSMFFCSSSMFFYLDVCQFLCL